MRMRCTSDYAESQCESNAHQSVNMPQVIKHNWAVNETFTEGWAMAGH